MIKEKKIKFIEFQDNPKVIAAISDWVKEEIRVSYRGKTPTLKVKNLRLKPGDILAKGVNFYKTTFGRISK